MFSTQRRTASRATEFFVSNRRTQNMIISQNAEYDFFLFIFCLHNTEHLLDSKDRL
jgi:hypothetical protein